MSSMVSSSYVSENLYFSWISPSFLLSEYISRKGQIVIASSAPASGLRTFYLLVMDAEESPWGFCRDALNHLIVCQPRSSLFIARIFRDFLFSLFTSCYLIVGRAKDCSKSAASQKYFSEMFTPASSNWDRLQLTCTPN